MTGGNRIIRDRPNRHAVRFIHRILRDYLKINVATAKYVDVGDRG